MMMIIIFCCPSLFIRSCILLLRAPASAQLHPPKKIGGDVTLLYSQLGGDFFPLLVVCSTVYGGVKILAVLKIKEQTSDGARDAAE